jgi:hypothetical protein
MQKNKIAILLLFFLGTAAAWLVINNSTSTINKAFRNFSVSDTASINKIILTNKSGSIVLERQTKGSWKLNKNHYADNFALKRLLYTICKVDVKTPVAKNDENAVVKKLVEHAVKCDIYINGELQKSYYVGDATPDNMGTYMVLIDTESKMPSERPFITYVLGYNNSITSHYSTDIKKWRDKTVFNYNEPDIQSIKVETPQNPQNSYELFIDKGKCQLKMLADKSIAKNIDTAIVNQYLTYFFNLRFETVDTTFAISKEQPYSIVTVTDVKGIANKVGFYLLKNTHKKSSTIASSEDNLVQLYALLDNGEVATVQLYLFGKIMPEIGYFLKK